MNKKNLAVGTRSVGPPDLFYGLIKFCKVFKDWNLKNPSTGSEITLAHMAIKL